MITKDPEVEFEKRILTPEGESGRQIFLVRLTAAQRHARLVRAASIEEAAELYVKVQEREGHIFDIGSGEEDILIEVEGPDRVVRTMKVSGQMEPVYTATFMSIGDVPSTIISSESV